MNLEITVTNTSIPAIARTPSFSKSVGIGYRSSHFFYIKKHLPAVPWFEILIDNYMVAGGIHLQQLDYMANHYPLSFHGVGLSLGSKPRLNFDHLKQLKNLYHNFQPFVISEHLAWLGIDGQYFPELFPLPYTEEALQTIVTNIQEAQEYLGCQLLIENISSYIEYNFSQMTEAEFLAEVVNRTGCGLLLDINNLYVNARNHDIELESYLMKIPKSAVQQFHLAGYTDKTDYLLDTHGEKISNAVWSLYEMVLNYFGCQPTLIEWDNNIPEFLDICQEAQLAQDIMERVCERA